MLTTSYTTQRSDKELVITAVITCLALFILLSIAIPGSQIPLLVVIFIFTNMLSKTKLFASLVQRARPQFNKIIDAFTLQNPNRIGRLPSSNNSNYNRFLSLNEDSKLELLTAITSLQTYATNSKGLNSRRRKLFKLMSWRQQELCEGVGYLNKLQKLDNSIMENQRFLGEIATFAIDSYGLSYQDFDYLKNNSSSQQTSASNYRVIETIGHFNRDWAKDEETKPLLDYITGQLPKIIPDSQKEKTCIIVAGSGLGKIAYEVAKLGFAQVRAVEFSGLMHVCNQFIYHNQKNHSIFPYVHTTSNFVNTLSQLRTSELKPVEKPENLVLDLQDFRKLEIDDKFDNVVVISAFFIDTAENLIDYFDKIKELTASRRSNNIKNGYWINIGPLKYGTAALVELNAEEIQRIRKQMGWKDIDYRNEVEAQQLVGYVTDRESFWQGYYGLSKWTSARKENANK